VRIKLEEFENIQPLRLRPANLKSVLSATLFVVNDWISAKRPRRPPACQFQNIFLVAKQCSQRPYSSSSKFFLKGGQGICYDGTVKEGECQLALFPRQSRPIGQGKESPVAKLKTWKK
jgi:hypothetical protein